MKKTDGTIIKAFTCLSRQDYYDAEATNMIGIVDSVTFGNFNSDGNGCEYEAKMEWVAIAPQASPRLCVFHDAFKLFGQHKELIEEIKKLNDREFSPDEFSRLLLKLGYTDMSDIKL